jgi:hypothetical protein
MRVSILAVGLAGLLSAVAWAGAAAAQTCTNDVDCPTAACGGEVCQWAAAHTCVAAGTDSQGTDGWCTVDTDCKCKGEGATCVAPHCTFTLPRDGGYSSSGSGSSSSSGAAGSSSGVAVVPDADVSSGSTTPGGTGGCAVASTGGRPAGSGLALACAAVLALARRRRAVHS